MSSINSEHSAIIIFTAADRWFLKALKPGYEHCIILYPVSTGYIMIEPMLNGMELREVKREAVAHLLDLAGKEQCSILASRINQRGTKLSVPSFFSCVEVAKRLLNIQAFWVITPYQLHNHLIKTGGHYVTDYTSLV